MANTPTFTPGYSLPFPVQSDVGKAITLSKALINIDEVLKLMYESSGNWDLAAWGDGEVVTFGDGTLVSN